MSKRAPSTAQLLVIAGFALSCFGILLFLWITFGGPTPFKAKPYEIKIPFDEAAQLAAAVRRADLRRQRRQSPEHRTRPRQAGDRDDRHRRPVRAAAQGHAGAAAHQDAARGDLRRTDDRQSQRAQARRRRNAAGGERRPVGPDRRDLPHLQRPDPRRLPGMDAERRDRDPGPGPGLLRRPRRTRHDLHRIRQALPHPRHPEARRAPALQQRRRRPATPSAAAKASSPT